MDFEVPLAHGTFRGSITVPPSKSMLQRVLVLNALTDIRATVRGADPQAGGDDVRALDAALRTLGRWDAGTLGADRASRRVDLGLGATGFRFLLPLAALRPRGARTLVTGRARLLARPHRPLLTALSTLGVRWKRRHSGAIRVLGGGYTGAPLVLDGRLSSQYASALMLTAPRTGGLTLRFAGACVSRPYLALTREALATFGIRCTLADLDGRKGHVRVEPGVPQAESVEVAPDASAAAGVLAAAALTGGSVHVPGLRADDGQADLALLPLLRRMGATVETDETGVRVTGPGGRLRTPGEVALGDAPDLLPIVAALAATAQGETRIHGVAHARGKESDRVATSAAAIRALGGRVDIRADGLVVREAPLEGACVDVAGDHRIAFAFGALGLVVPGVVLRGAEAVSKSHPGFLADLGRIARPA